MKPVQSSETNSGRRSFLKKASYVVPAIVTLSALPSFASAGSGYQTKEKEGAFKIVDELSAKYPERSDFWQKLREWIFNW